MIDPFPGQVFIIGIIHAHHRRSATGGQAFFTVKGEFFVRGGLSDLDIEFLRGVFQKIVRPVELAADVMAKENQVFPDGVGVIHRIEGAY